MNLLQAIIQRLVCLGVAVCGVLLIWAWCTTGNLHPEDLVTQVNDWRLTVIDVIDTPKGLKSTAFYLVGGGLLTIIGLLGLLPVIRLRTRNKVISFQGTHGEVVIQLDSIEATLNRVIGKMPEVKKITVNVLPADDNRRVRITADLLLYKDLKAGARETSNRISQYIADTAVNILGVEEVTSVDLNVRGIIVDQVAPALPLDHEEPVPPEPAVPIQESVVDEQLPLEETALPAEHEPVFPGSPLTYDEEPLTAAADEVDEQAQEVEPEPEGEDSGLFLDEETPEDQEEDEEDTTKSPW